MGEEDENVNINPEVFEDDDSPDLGDAQDDVDPL